MPVCVECGKPVNDTYKRFKGKGNIRLTKCVTNRLLFCFNVCLGQLPTICRQI